MAEERNIIMDHTPVVKLLLITLILPLTVLAGVNVGATPPLKAPHLYVTKVNFVSDQFTLVSNPALNQKVDGLNDTDSTSLNPKLFNVSGNYSSLRVTLAGKELYNRELDQLKRRKGDNLTLYALPSPLEALQDNLPEAKDGYKALRKYNGTQLRIFLDEKIVREFTLAYSGYGEQKTSESTIPLEPIIVLVAALIPLIIPLLAYRYLNYDRKTRILIALLLFVLLSLIAFLAVRQLMLAPVRMRGAPA